MKNINDIMITTTNTFEGYAIVKYIDVISEEVLFSEKLTSQIKNQMKDSFSFINSIFNNTELTGTSNAILQAKEYVKEKLKYKAMNIGANAIVGIDFETTIGNSSTFIRVSVNGTAVIIKSEAELSEYKKQKAIEDEKNRMKQIEVEEMVRRIIKDNQLMSLEDFKKKSKEEKDIYIETIKSVLEKVEENKKKELYRHLVDLGCIYYERFLE